jgi:hypothetical protein
MAAGCRRWLESSRPWWDVDARRDDSLQQYTR